MALGYLINACITGGHYTANGAILFLYSSILLEGIYPKMPSLEKLNI